VLLRSCGVLCRESATEANSGDEKAPRPQDFSRTEQQVAVFGGVEGRILSDHTRDGDGLDSTPNEEFQVPPEARQIELERLRIERGRRKSENSSELFSQLFGCDSQSCRFLLHHAA
jgi:hypothetical protein